MARWYFNIQLKEEIEIVNREFVDLKIYPIRFKTLDMSFRGRVMELRLRYLRESLKKFS